jgi:hypothetical protein
MTDIIEFLRSLYDPLQFKVLVALLAADVILAIAVCISKGQFLLGQTADFLRTRFVPYVLAYYALKAVALVDPTLDLGVTVVWAAIIAAEVGRILGHLKDIGIDNIPRSLTK